MSKSLVTFFFLSIFMSLIVAPSLLVAINDTIDVSSFYSISEEEEEQGNKNDKEFEVLILEPNNELEGIDFTCKTVDMEYRNKFYSKPHLNLISPPPERI